MNKILLTLSLLLAIVNPFTLEGFILELVMCGIFYKQYSLYCKKCKPRNKVSDTISNYGLMDMK